MHDLNNESPWQATLAPGYSHRREQLAMVIIKAGYAIDVETGALTPLKKKPAIEAADQHEGDPLKSALKAAGESSPPKVGGEFYILGATLALPNVDTTAAEASVTLTYGNGRQFDKTIRAIGKRQWQGTWMLPSAGKPEPLTAISLGYENAYGGSDEEAGPKEKQPTYLANYAGKGYLADAKRCSGAELPQLEIAPFINSPSDRPQPAGFGPVPVFWQPRRAEQGTPDLEAAKRGGCPYGPDAQATMHNSAPLDQRFPNPWQGGEILTLTNILAGLQYGKTCRITLPRNTPQLTLIENGMSKPLSSVCDTFWIDAQKNRLFMIYRAAYPMRLAKPTRGWIVVSDAQATTSAAQREAA
ncbi:MAG: DUF2169 domain-containing protein [Gammaproteobacteria bacterium]|nr:DUF2169 domain-containing protein [Gammaproteobacteria bacterium]MBU1482083.1 DUF2169 domain-containing protein [Gammaproteobacteria bacterium]